MIFEKIEEVNLEDFHYNIAFNSICYNIKGKLNLTETSKIYIEWAKEYFENVKKSLDSILNPQTKMFHITPHLKEVLECSKKYREKISLDEVKRFREKIISLDKNLSRLSKNPQKFYNTKDSEEVFNFINKIVPCFD
jgi:hypothetical protein